MSKQAWKDKLSLAQETTNRATRQELARDYSSAYETYVRAGDLYLWLVKNREPTSEATELRERLRRVLGRAEAIKLAGRSARIVERRLLSDEEQTRALEASSSIDGIPLPLWKSTDDISTLAYQGQLFVDSVPQPALAPGQVQQKATFRRRHSWLKQRDSVPRWASSPLYDYRTPLRGHHIVQDVVTDCSFVAALEVACEHDATWHTQLAHAPLYPKDSRGFPRWSENGRHCVKLLFNGIPRQIVIDDSIPCRPDGNPVCATGLGADGSYHIWPALLEKAYLRLRGGYDFQGSNSSIDLHALTGWIPEHIGFQHAGFQREKAWDRLRWAWTRGYIMVTAGTTRNMASRRAPGQAFLVDSHNYAVLAIDEEEGERWLTLMNPWRRSPSEEDASTWTGEMRASLENFQTNSPSYLDREIIRITWSEACSRLDSLYLNWNPAIAKHALTVHSHWRKVDGSDLGQNPEQAPITTTTKPTTMTTTAIVGPSQHSSFRLAINVDESDVSGAEKTDVWLHLVRHTTRSREDEVQWIAIHVFESEAVKHRLLAHGSDYRMGTYVDSTHNIVRFSTSAHRRSVYTVIVSRNGCNNDATFSLSAFSAAKIELHDIPRSFSFSQLVQSGWSGKSAGGNAASWAFIHNPQFRLTVPQATSLAAMVETSKDLPVQVLIVWSRRGKRISHVSEGDIVASSGLYNYGFAFAEAKKIQAGVYSVIVSTFEEGLSGLFALKVESEGETVLEAIAAEGAGMFHKTLRGRWEKDVSAMGGPSHGRYHCNPRFIVDVDKACRLVVRLRPEVKKGLATPYLNIALFRVNKTPRSASSISPAASPPDIGAEVANSGSYADLLSGVAIEDARLEPGTYSLIASTFTPGVECPFVIDLYSSLPTTCRRAH